jgi:hypothetical protein
MARTKDSTKSERSRYAHGGTTERSKTRLEYWDRAKIRRDATDDTYILEDIYEGRPDLLASVMYGDSRLWWVICQFNGILDTQTEFVAGTVLTLPTKERIEKEILRTTSAGGVASKREPRKKIDQIIV